MIRTYRAHRRAYAVLFTTVFSFAGWADASGLHLCPQHDALPGAESLPHDAAADHGQTDLAGAAQAHAGSSHAGGHEGPCSCIGSFDDEGSAVHATLPDAVFLDFPTIAYVAGATARSTILVPSLYRLPYANAPPRLI